MANGLTVYNDASTLQIDSNYRNLLLVSKKSYNGNSVISQSGVIFAFSGKGYILDGLGGDDRLWVFGSGTVYGFSLIDAMPSNNGLEVYDENGKLCFSSSSKPMRVIDMLNAPFFSDTKPVINRNYGVSKTAVVAGQPYIAWRNGTQYNTGVYDIDNNSGLTMTPLPIIITDKNTYDKTDLSKFMGEYNYLVLDVSNY